MFEFPWPESEWDDLQAVIPYIDPAWVQSIESINEFMEKRPDE